jgi:hypothetical protein
MTKAVQALKAVTPPLDERSKYLRRLVVRTLHGGERGPRRFVDVTRRNHARGSTTTSCAIAPTTRNGRDATA